MGTSALMMILADSLFQLSEGKFDILSALAGAAVGAVIAFLVYRFRSQLASLRGLLKQRVGTYQARSMRGHEARYRDSVVDQANKWHLAGHLVALERIGVQPRFLPVPRPYDPRSHADDDEIEGPFSLVPLVLDYPQLAGVYGLPGVDIPHVLGGAPGIALLGAPGGGRSCALAMMAILAARQTRANQEGGLLGELRIPVLFHMGDVDLSPEMVQGDKDPAEILLAAALKRMSGGGARSAPGIIPPAMAAGLCVVFADGWDELPPAQRARTMAWFNALRETYPDNRFVVAGPSRGYAPLIESGLTPVYLQPWSDNEFEELAVRWAEAWPQIAGSRRGSKNLPDEDLVRRVSRGNRARTPLDVTLKAWSSYAGDEQSLGRRGWYSSYVMRMLPVEQAREALARMAAEALRFAGSGGEEMLGVPEEQAKAFVDAALARAGGLAMDTPDFLYEISQKTPILVERVGGRYAFAHPVVRDFLAAEILAGDVRRLKDSGGALSGTMPFVAEVDDVTSLVGDVMDEDPEILYENLLALATWAEGAPADAAWRTDLLRRLAQVLLSPSQFPTVRRRISAGLVASRDPNIAQVFRQGLRAENPVARMVSAFGLGAFGSADLVSVIADGLADSDVTVQIAAALALGATGGEEAMDYMVQFLFEGTEAVRRAVAESLANDPVLGYQLLREAINEEDVLVRRAAIYGLARIREPWALEILEERQIQDDEWFVRDAAREAVERHELGTAQRIPQPFPPPTEIAWLVEWAAERGEAVPAGQQGIEYLIRVLQEGEESVRYAAADALGKLGGVRAVKPLYASLADSSAIVREGAYEALAAISQSLGKPLPAVV